MKVMCVINGGWRSSITGQKVPGPVFGETCTVAGLDEEYYYLLDGYNGPGNEEGYDPEEFIPLSDIDEPALAKERETEEEFA